MSMKTSSRTAGWKAVAWGGLWAGMGDYIFALSFYGWKPGVFQTVAGGLIGREAALAGGVATFLLGTALHFVIAGIWAGIFWVLAKWIPLLVRGWVVAGMVYGLVVYLGMNCVVLPSSALNVPVRWPPMVSWPAAAHVVLVGLPIAGVVRRVGCGG